MVGEIISSNPEVLGGTPVFRGTRVPVAVLFENLADNLALSEILESYPTIQREQAVQALHLALQLLEAHVENGRLDRH